MGHFCGVLIVLVRCVLVDLRCWVRLPIDHYPCLLGLSS